MIYEQEIELFQRLARIEDAVKKIVKNNQLEESLGFQHVAIKQKKNICKSRLDVDIKSEVLRGIFLDIPMISANMSSVTNASFCVELEKLGAMGILHRAASDEMLEYETYEIAQHNKNVAVSIGVGEGQLELARKLVDKGANIVTIDIAHGFSPAVIETGRRIKQELPVKLIVGNTNNTDMMYEVADFADAVKVGLSNGAACETKNSAGVVEGQFSAVIKFKKISKKLGLPIISDGGIREGADFVKAIGAGANSIMAGSIFARCPESAAENVSLPDGSVKKKYFGMASRTAQDKWKGGVKSGTCPEGTVRYLDMGESAGALLERYSGALRSGITYAGGNDIKSFHESVEFVRIV